MKVAQGLKVSFRAGRPYAAYFHFTHEAGERAARTEQVSESILVDYLASGKPLGIEILAPGRIPRNELDALLKRIGAESGVIDELEPVIVKPSGEQNAPFFTMARRLRKLPDFVVGPGNAGAWEAALDHCRQPRKTPYPLVVLGGFGLGKSHLLVMLAHELQNHLRQVLFVSGEAFVRDQLAGAETHWLEEFQSAVHSAEAVVVDDVHLMASHEVMRDELRRVIEAEGQSGKQLIFSSAPSAGQDVNVSMFAGRCNEVQLEPLGLATRMDYIGGAATSLGLQLASQTIQWLAQSQLANVGALHAVLVQISQLPLASGLVGPDQAKSAVRTWQMTGHYRPTNVF